MERGSTLNAVSLLRVITGAVVSVWGKGSSRAIITPTLTAGIRGTGVYSGIFPNQRSYFYNCHGTVDLELQGQKTVPCPVYHQDFWGEVEAKNLSTLIPAHQPQRRRA